MSTPKPINVVLAATKSHGIGLNNSLPWRLKQELRHFRAITTSYNLSESQRQSGLQNAIVMGRKTWESLPNNTPLPNRKNIILTTQKASKILSTVPKPSQDNLQIVGSLPELFAFIDSSQASINEVSLIGGADITQQAISAHSHRIKNIFLTRISKDFPCDTFMPADWLQNFHLTEISQTMSENDCNYDYTRYINPKFAGSHFEELFTRKIFTTKHAEFEYLDLIGRNFFFLKI
jgi:dihydrofolate reductase